MMHMFEVNLKGLIDKVHSDAINIKNIKLN